MDLTNDLWTKNDGAGCKNVGDSLAAPYSCIGLAVGIAGMLSGGRGRYRQGALEVVAAQPLVVTSASASTHSHHLGPRDHRPDSPDAGRLHDHERVHVRQFERWGPFMGPACLCRAWLWCRGRNTYTDNPN